MPFEEEARLVHEHVELIHKLNLAMADALLQVAEESGTPPADLAQMVGFGGGGLSTIFHPLVMRHHQRQQQQMMAMQHRAAAPDKTES